MRRAAKIFGAAVLLIALLALVGAALLAAGAASLDAPVVVEINGRTLDLAALQAAHGIDGIGGLIAVALAIGVALLVALAVVLVVVPLALLAPVLVMTVLLGAGLALLAGAAALLVSPLLVPVAIVAAAVWLVRRARARSGRGRRAGDATMTG